MAKTKTTSLTRDAGPYVRRLRRAYQRAERKNKGAKTAEDKKLYAHVRGAPGSLRGAAMALQRNPPPKPKRRGRKVMLVGALAGGAVLLAKRGSRQAEPVAPASRG
jgi:hypothetical protein